MQERRVLSLGWEDPLESEMATHSSIPAWKISLTEELGGLQSTELHRVRHDSVRYYWAQHNLLLLTGNFRLHPSSWTIKHMANCQKQFAFLGLWKIFTATKQMLNQNKGHWKRVRYFCGVLTNPHLRRFSTRWSFWR